MIALVTDDGVYAGMGAVGAMLVGLGALSAVIVKRMGKENDLAQLRKTQAETDSIHIGNLQHIIDEVRESDDKKTVRLVQLETRYDEAIRRIDKLEERERYNLIRSAVHEAWDRLAFQRLFQLDPTFPPPPPLMDHAELERSEDKLGQGNEG